MKAVWSIVCRGIAEQRTRWVIVGSPGVGKSVLTVLASFHLARSFNRPVFLARQLKGEGRDENSRGTVALCIHPGGLAVAYPKKRGGYFNMLAISAPFFESHERVLTILDGWSQQELVGTPIGADYGSFQLLATSAQYFPKSQDGRHLVMLPAWLEADLKCLWKLGRGGAEDEEAFNEQYYYSGGSAREFGRPIDDVRNRINIATLGTTEESCKNILAGYGGSLGAPHDSLRRAYLSDRNPDSYKSSDNWVYAIDSAYALRRLKLLAPLSVFKRSIEVAKASGCISLYGQMFEVFVHQLFSLPNLSITFHLRDAKVMATGEYNESVRLCKYSAECVGGKLDEAMEYLSSRTMNTSSTTYWYPDFAQFPAIDAVACTPDSKTVLYIQFTAGKEKVANETTLSTIHQLVKGSLEKSLSATSGNIEDWAFRYIAIAPSQQQADDLKLTATQGFAAGGGITFSKGYVTHSAE